MDSFENDLSVLYSPKRSLECAEEPDTGITLEASNT